MHHNLESSTCDPLKYTMGCLIRIVSLYMAKSIRIQRVNFYNIYDLNNDTQVNNLGPSWPLFTKGISRETTRASFLCLSV